MPASPLPPSHTAPSPQATPPRRGRTVLRIVLLGVVLLLGVFFAGPRNSFGSQTPTARASAPEALEQLDAWLQSSEAAYPDLKPGTAKGIVWHGADKVRKPWSVVYLHGFSASRLETAPLAEQVGRALGAHVFYARLSGHGRSSSSAMGEATVQDWLADAQEAVQIGQRLGERVLLISCSTGSTLATWLATQPQGRQVAAHAFVSPNFGPKDKMSELINGPWGQQIALAVEGETRGKPGTDPREEAAWTSRYPTKALFPMMALVKQVRESDLSAFQAPVLMLYSEADRTVDPQETKAAFARMGSSQKSLVAVDYSEARGQHVLAGDIRAPKATAPMAATISAWAQALPLAR